MVISDVVEAILVRLPADDLLRCKSVDKSWYSLISSPPFIKTHAKFMCSKEEGRKISKILSHKDWPTRGNSRDTPDEWKAYTEMWIEGSSNGLVFCVCLPGLLFCLSNPVTREFRQVTQAPSYIPKERRCYGFGYDSSTDDYKVVVAISLPDRQTSVSILSLKSNVWHVFSGQVNYSFRVGCLQKPGILLHGALHWFWFDAANDKQPLIVSFDLAKEEFKEIPQPHDTRYVWNGGCTLGIIDGRLCIYHNSHDFPSCGTWVIKKYHHLNPSWERLSKKRSRITNHAIHHFLNNYTPGSPAYYSCDENIHLSRSKEYIPSPIFVKTLVSPFFNNGQDNKSTANAGSVKEKRGEGSL